MGRANMYRATYALRCLRRVLMFFICWRLTSGGAGNHIHLPHKIGRLLGQDSLGGVRSVFVVLVSQVDYE